MIHIPPVLLVILLSLFVSILSEFLGWLFVYRTTKYKALKSRVVQLLDQYEKGKSGDVKKFQKIESQLKQEHRNVQMTKAKGTFFLGIIMIFVYKVLASKLDGEVVAVLPFEPLKLIRGITHRRLDGFDWTHCSMSFIYALCSASLRANIVKLTGFQPPKLPAELQFGAPSS
ncbi:hypothetical protein RCL1_006465 [Eukaryota sp. TZLM3-RCL]